MYWSVHVGICFALQIVKKSVIENFIPIVIAAKHLVSLYIAVSLGHVNSCCSNGSRF